MKNIIILVSCLFVLLLLLGLSLHDFSNTINIENSTNQFVQGGKNGDPTPLPPNPPPPPPPGRTISANWA